MAEGTQAQATENPVVPQQQGTGSSSVPQPSDQQAATNAGQTAQQQQPSTNITDHPDVRRMQAAKDAEIARLRRAAEDARRTADQERAERDRQFRAQQVQALDTLDADDAKAAAIKMVRERDEQAERERQSVQAQAALRDQAWEALNEANTERAEVGLPPLKPDDARLRFAGGSPAEVLATMQASLRRAALEDARAALDEAKKVAKRDVVAALNDAGVTRVGSSENATPVNPKLNELKGRYAKIKGTGNTQAWTKLLADARAAGISVESLK